MTAPSEAVATSAAYLPSTPRVSPGPVGLKAAMRASYSASSIRRLMVFLTASISILSPLLTMPMGTFSGFGSDVADVKTMTATREAAVCDEGYFFNQAAASNRAGR